MKGENAINVTYHIEPDSVRINILFEGGEDDMIFTQEDNYTIFTLIQSPD